MAVITPTNPTATFSSGQVLVSGETRYCPGDFAWPYVGDVIAYVPDANVVFTRDLDWSRTLPNPVDATVSDWIPTLDQILTQYPTAMLQDSVAEYPQKLLAHRG